MAKFSAGPQRFPLTLIPAGGSAIGLHLAPARRPEETPHEVDGALTPADATEQFTPGGIPREWDDWSAGGGYSFYDPRVPNGYAWAKNVWLMTPHVAVPAGKLTEIPLPETDDGGAMGEITDGVEVLTHVYLAAGAYGLKIPQGYQNPTLVANFKSITGHSDYLVKSVCLYLQKAYWGGYLSSTGIAGNLVEHVYTTDGFTAAQDVAGADRWLLRSFGGLDGNGTWAQWLVGTTYGNSTFKYTNSSNPLVDANWTPGSANGTQVGDPSFSISSLVASRQAVYFVKQEGVFSIQRMGAYMPNITPHWLGMTYQYNGVASAIVGGRLFANTIGGLDMVVGLDGQLNDTPYFVQPGADLPNETPVAGTIWALAQDGDWLVAAVYNEGNQTSYLCWGKPRSSVPGQPGITNFIWHMSPCVIEGEKVTWMRRIAPFGQPRLLIATRTTAGVTKLYWLSLPRDGNVLQDIDSGGPWRCRTDTCTLYLPSDTWGRGPAALKALRHVASVSRDCSNTSRLAMYANPDEGGRTQLGSNVLSSPYQASLITADVSGRQIAPSVDFLAGVDTEPPILRSLRLRAGVGVEPTSTLRYRVRFGSGMRDRKKSVDDRDPQIVWNRILASQGPRPATLIDPKGNTYTVAFDQGASWIEREVRDGNSWFIEATLSFTVLARQIVYGDGTLWGRGDFWGGGAA